MVKDIDLIHIYLLDNEDNFYRNGLIRMSALY